MKEDLELVPIEKLGWMQEFKFTEFESYCRKTDMRCNYTSIGFLSVSGDLFWCAEGSLVIPGPKLKM